MDSAKEYRSVARDQGFVFVCCTALLTSASFAFACGGSETVGPQETPQTNVVVTKDLTFAEAASQSVVDRDLDVYVPAESGVWPVAVVLHGGSASKDHVDITEFSERVAEEGVVVFVPTYGGGTPEHVISQGGRFLREFLESSACAVRYARQHAADFNGDPSRVTVIGQSAGGVFGSIVSLLENNLDLLWDDLVTQRGEPQRQMSCVAAQSDVEVAGFVGFNGAYFIFKSLDLPEYDPDLWELVNLENHVGENPSLVVRFMFGKSDFSQPPWHLSDANQFIENLRAAGYDADTTQVAAGHGFSFVEPGWGTTLAVTLDVIRR